MEGVRQDGPDFESEVSIPNLGFARLVWSDYRAATYSGGTGEAVPLALALFPLRLLINPSIQLALLVRIAQKGPRPLEYPVRLLQVLLFSSEIYWFHGDEAIEIGPGIAFPHPYGIAIGPAVRIGTGVTIYQYCILGADRHWVPGEEGRAGVGRSPVLGDRCVLYSHSSLQGPWRVGHDAVVGIRVIVDKDVPPGGLLTHKRLRLAGQWPGESDRVHWRGARQPA